MDCSGLIPGLSTRRAQTSLMAKARTKEIGNQRSNSPPHNDPSHNSDGPWRFVGTEDFSRARSIVSAAVTADWVSSRSRGASVRVRLRSGRHPGRFSGPATHAACRARDLHGLYFTRRLQSGCPRRSRNSRYASPLRLKRELRISCLILFPSLSLKRPSVEHAYEHL